MATDLELVRADLVGGITQENLCQVHLSGRGRLRKGPRLASDDVTTSLQDALTELPLIARLVTTRCRPLRPLTLLAALVSMAGLQIITRAARGQWEGGWRTVQVRGYPATLEANSLTDYPSICLNG